MAGFGANRAMPASVGKYSVLKQKCPFGGKEVGETGQPKFSKILPFGTDRDEVVERRQIANGTDKSFYRMNRQFKREI